jgi:hypothetical protein
VLDLSLSDLRLPDFAWSGLVPPSLTVSIAAARPTVRRNFTILLHGPSTMPMPLASARIDAAVLLGKPPAFK